nr:hypothetical protein [Acholeplasmatales bacterium]
IAFICTLITSIFVYKLVKFSFKERDNLIISNGTNQIRAKDIVKIKARKFLFLYSFDIYSKPFSAFASMSFYFDNEKELIEFVKDKEILFDLIRDEDLKRLGISKNEEKL